MTIDELIARLAEYRDELGGETEVRLMTQPTWPFEHAIHGLVSVSELKANANANADDEDFDCHGNADQVVYLVEGAQLGYGTKTAWVQTQ
jgi:hypothetical protein